MIHNPLLKIHHPLYKVYYSLIIIQSNEIRFDNKQNVEHYCQTKFHSKRKQFYNKDNHFSIKKCPF